MPEKSQREQLLKLGPEGKINQLLSQSIFFERDGTTYVLSRNGSPFEWLRTLSENGLLEASCEKVGLGPKTTEEITNAIGHKLSSDRTSPDDV